VKFNPGRVRFNRIREKRWDARGHYRKVLEVEIWMRAFAPLGAKPRKGQM